MDARRKKRRFEDIPITEAMIPKIENLCKVLSRQTDKETFKNKYLPAFTILKLVGAGFFLAGAVVFPNLPLVLKPFVNESRQEEYKAWKRFNISYLKRTLERLEKQKLVSIEESEGKQVIKITGIGMKKILKFSLDQIEIRKPKVWDGNWWLISYDIPGDLKGAREFLRDYLLYWGFYPMHESVFLHAYPCRNEIEFLREYLGVSQYVRIFLVSEIENDELFKDYFDV